MTNRTNIKNVTIDEKTIEHLMQGTRNRFILNLLANVVIETTHDRYTNDS